MALRKSVIMNRHRKSFTSRSQKQSQQYQSSTNTKLNVIIKEEDEEALLQEELSELTYTPFRTKAFKKVLNGSTNVGLFLNNKGTHIKVIHKALEKLVYTQTVNDITCFEEATERNIRGFQEAKELNISGYLNAETLWAMNIALEGMQEEETKEILSTSERAKMLYEAFTHKTFLFFGGTDEEKIFIFFIYAFAKAYTARILIN